MPSSDRYMYQEQAIVPRTKMSEHYTSAVGVNRFCVSGSRWRKPTDNRVFAHVESDIIDRNIFGMRKVWHGAFYVQEKCFGRPSRQKVIRIAIGGFNIFKPLDIVVVDLGYTTLLTSQDISVAFYSEREKSDKFCSEALISAWGSFTYRKSTTRDPRFYHGRLARWRKWKSCDVGEAKEGLENELWRRWSNGRVGELAVT